MGWERVIPRWICGEAKPRGYKPSAPGPRLLTPEAPDAHHWAQGPRNPCFRDNTALIRGWGRCRVGAPLTGPPCVPVAPSCPGLHCVPQPTRLRVPRGQSSLLHVWKPEKPACGRSCPGRNVFQELQFWRGSERSGHPPQIPLSQQTAWLFLQSGSGPSQPCSFVSPAGPGPGPAVPGQLRVVTWGPGGWRGGHTAGVCALQLRHRCDFCSLACVSEENHLPAFHVSVPRLADGRPRGQRPGPPSAPSSPPSPAQPRPGYPHPPALWPLAACVAGGPVGAAGAPSVGGASRALGTAAGALAGRVQPERRHVPAPLQQKASESSRLEPTTERSPCRAAAP